MCILTNKVGRIQIFRQHNSRFPLNSIGKEEFSLVLERSSLRYVLASETLGRREFPYNTQRSKFRCY